MEPKYYVRPSELQGSGEGVLAAAEYATRLLRFKDERALGQYTKTFVDMLCHLSIIPLKDKKSVQNQLSAAMQKMYMQVDTYRPDRATPLSNLQQFDPLTWLWGTFQHDMPLRGIKDLRDLFYVISGLIEAFEPMNVFMQKYLPKVQAVTHKRKADIMKMYPDPHHSFTYTVEVLVADYGFFDTLNQDVLKNIHHLYAVKADLAHMIKSKEDKEIMDKKDKIIEVLREKQKFAIITHDADFQWRDAVGYVELSDGSVCPVAPDMMEDPLTSLYLDNDEDPVTDLSVSSSNQTFTWFEKKPTRESLREAVSKYNQAISDRMFEHQDTSVDDSVKIVDYDLI